jgi:hypothetical protein
VQRVSIVLLNLATPVSRAAERMGRARPVIKRCLSGGAEHMFWDPDRHPVKKGGVEAKL